MRAVEIELQVPCSEGIHTVRVRLESWEQWTVVSTECMELMGRAFGLMAECHHRTKERGREVRLQAVERLLQARAVPFLIQALQDEDWMVRAAACEALGEVGDETAIPALLKIAENKSYDSVEARMAIRRITDPRLLSLLHSLKEDEGARFAACEAMAKFGKRAVPFLLHALDSGNSEVRVLACHALGWICDASTLPALEGRLRDPSLRVREAAEKAIQHIYRFGGDDDESGRD